MWRLCCLSVVRRSALADIGSAIGDLLAPLDLYPVACQIQGTMITYFDLASALWVLNITLQLEFLLVRAGATAPNPESYEKIYHAVGWLPPIAAAVLPYIVAGGYSANNGHCWLSVEAQASYPWLPYTIFYGPLWLIFVMVVVIFVRVRRHLRADVRDAAARKHILTKLMAYPAIFLVIWSFSTADKVVHDVTGSSPEWLQITHIVFSSLQGLFNAVSVALDAGGGAAAAESEFYVCDAACACVCACVCACTTDVLRHCPRRRDSPARRMVREEEHL